MMPPVEADLFPGDPVRAAAPIYEVVASEAPRHWVVLGSDAQRRIGAKLDMLRAEFEAGHVTARINNYPVTAKEILLPAPNARSKVRCLGEVMSGDGYPNLVQLRSTISYR